MVLHYSHLCVAAGGVDAFLIGAEMPGLTTIRSGASNCPAVPAFRDPAAAMRGIRGSATKTCDAADWSDCCARHPGDDEAGSALGSREPRNGGCHPISFARSRAEIWSSRKTVRKITTRIVPTWPYSKVS